MIFTMFFYVLSYIFIIISVVLPQWSLWPDNLLISISALANSFAGLNFFLPVSELFVVFLFVLNFEVLYLTAKIVAKVFNYLRGTGSGIDL